MSNDWNLTTCREHFGVKAKNKYWSWSARSDDGKKVAVNIWQDGVRWDGHKMLYALNIDESDLPLHGAVELVENLTGRAITLAASSTLS